MVMAPSRDLDFVLLGPTGYTGKLCAEHIAQHLPSDLKWALAGRSAEKLEKLKRGLLELNPNRLAPEILVVKLEKEDLVRLSKRAGLVINCVGPYHVYSTPVVEACANNGTHYIDVTGETPWVREIIAKYQEKAKETGAVIIPSAGVESTPPDLLSWLLVRTIQDNFSVGVKDVVIATHEMKTSGASGGTLSTILNVIQNYSVSDLAKSNDPFCLAYGPQPIRKKTRKPIIRKLFGVRHVPELGILTTSPAEMCDTATVYRSSTMMPDFYGRDFQTEILLKVRSTLVGALIHVGFRITLLAFLLPPIRWLVKKFIYGPGEGPTKEASKNDRVEYRGIAVADQLRANPVRAFGKMSHETGPYPLSGLLLAEAAMVILTSDRIKKNFTGFSTPAVLGQEFVDRLRQVGVSIEARIVNS